MEKQFREKKEKEILINRFKGIYNKNIDIYRNIVMLLNYCKAYQQMEGIYYLVPHTMEIQKSFNEVLKEMHSILYNDSQPSPNFWTNWEL